MVMYKVIYETVSHPIDAVSCRSISTGETFTQDFAELVRRKVKFPA
jgi:hypothetical protein